MPRSKYTEEDFKRYCLNKDLEYLGFHMEPKKGSVVEFICKKHRNKGIQEVDWSHLKTYTYGCSYCSGRGKTTEEISLEIKNKDVELVSEYLGNEKPIRCQCKACGNIWTTLPKVLITNGAGCPKCGRKMANQHEMKPHDQFVKELRAVDDTIEVIGKYAGTHRSVECRCRVCKTTWFGFPARMLREEAGCPHCNSSIGQRELERTLYDLNISYIAEYPIRVTGYKKEMRFDAYDVKNKIAFEFDGEQHYYPVSFGGNKQAAEEKHKRIKMRDDAKNQYCYDNGIILLRIPYWFRTNIKKYLIDTFIQKGLYLDNIKTA